MRSLLFIFFTLFIFSGVSAQYNDLRKLGDKAFKNKDYYQAAYFYKKAQDTTHSAPGTIPFYSSSLVLEKKIKTSHAYICYQLAESYRLYQNYTEAGVWYKKILDEKYEQDYPLARLWYGLSLRANKQFDESIKEIQQFAASYKGDSTFINIAKREISNCFFAKQQYASYATVEVSRMQEKLNDSAGNFALVKNGNKYWFTSSRFNEISKKHLNNIYSADTQNHSKPVIVSFEGADATKEMQYGTPSIDASGKRMYITCWYKEAGDAVMKIYLSEFKDNKWSPLVMLNNNVNTEKFNAFQPFVTSDGKRLFYVSNKPGGQGGDDIWVSDLDGSGSPLNSVNLGKTVNTPLDEQAPFYDQTHKRLVYSSKGFAGLGGFDFFETYENNQNWSLPVNLGYPTNSSKDDLYYFDDPDDNKNFYISSDRESDCCLSLFRGHVKSFTITGKIVDCDSHIMLQGAGVTLVTDTSKAQSSQGQETDQRGKYNFETMSRRPSKLIAESKGYFKKIIPLHIEIAKDTTVLPDICLQAYKVNAPIKINNVLYDLNKANLRPESKIGLDSLVVIMKNNPLIKAEIDAHTDSIGKDAYNLKLSQLRAQACVDYIIAAGIAKERITAKGYGKSKPIAPNSLPNGKDNPAGRQLNRRTEFTVKE